MTDFNELAKRIYEQNKAVGWWDDHNRCIFQTLQLVVTEIAEATEGARKDLMDDHLPHRKMEEVELADALIRILDLGGRCGWEYRRRGDFSKAIDNAKVLTYSEGKWHLSIVVEVAYLAENLDIIDHFDKYSNSKVRWVEDRYANIIDGILLYAATKKYNVIGALTEKLAYNAKRADHKRENRAKEHGKRF